MKTITWELPFKSIDYLESLTEDLINNPSVILITGIQKELGEINNCSITFKEVPGVDLAEAIFYTGAAIGAHSVSYSIQLEERTKAKNLIIIELKNVFENLFNLKEELPEVILLPQNAGDTVDEEGNLVIKEEKIVEEDIVDTKIVEEQEDILEIEEVENTKNPVTKKQVQEVIKKSKDTKAKAMLRRILKNFKKSII